MPRVGGTTARRPGCLVLPGADALGWPGAFYRPPVASVSPGRPRHDVLAFCVVSQRVGDNGRRRLSTTCDAVP